MNSPCARPSLRLFRVVIGVLLLCCCLCAYMAVFGIAALDASLISYCEKQAAAQITAPECPAYLR